jgi:hypothetical protein
MSDALLSVSGLPPARALPKCCAGSISRLPLTRPSRVSDPSSAAARTGPGSNSTTALAAYVVGTIVALYAHNLAIFLPVIANLVACLYWAAHRRFDRVFLADGCAHRLRRRAEERSGYPAPGGRRPVPRRRSGTSVGSPVRGRSAAHQLFPALVQAEGEAPGRREGDQALSCSGNTIRAGFGTSGCLVVSSRRYRRLGFRVIIILGPFRLTNAVPS